MFKQARWKLTIWYSLLVLFISGFLSLLFYFRTTSVIQDEYNRIERRIQMEMEGFGNQYRISMPGRRISLEDLAMAKHLIALQLLLINGVIVITFSAVAYLLAGITLEPIRLSHEEQKRFVGDAAHELKTPLSALRTSMEVSLMNKRLAPVAKKVLRENLIDVKNLQSLSDSLLKLARVEGKNLKLQPVIVLECVQRAIRAIGPLAKKKGIEIQVINEAPKAIVMAEDHGLLDVLMILLDNAIKYSKEKSEIKVLARLKKNSLQILVIDQGCGIPKQSLSHIFDRFYQVDKARSKDVGSGVGLGLAVAKKTMTQFGGSIKVSSVVNQGSVFTLSLPKLS